MSKTQPEKKPAPVRAKAQIGAAAFGNLRAALGEDTRGEAIQIALSLIDEDPNQPRRHFDDAEMERLADSIRERGVLQPIVVRPAAEGRHVLVMGARRLRASRLAGLAQVPAILRRAEEEDYAAQVIENQQRTNLSNSELADAVGRFAAEGRTTKQIGTICNLKDYQVAAFRKANEFPPELRARMDSADMRALYDLFRQWAKTPAEVLAALLEADAFLTITEARRIIGAITGKPTGSIVLDKPAEALVSTNATEKAAPEQGAARAEEASASPSSDPAAKTPSRLPSGKVKPVPPPPVQTQPAEASKGKELDEVATQSTQAPVFIVRTRDGSKGRLVVDRRAERDGWALVQLGRMVEEVDPAELAFERIE